MSAPPRRKLIEVALPLEKINAEAAREKSIRHGHPSTLHLWWARRPLAAARAVLFAQLVDDPSSFPDRFPTEEAVRVERKRLHDLIERLVVWENSNDEGLLAEAHAEILASTDGHPPAILDPFCGGGTIPLEAQRLGLEAHGSDLNPVAVLITKALVEIPPKFANRPPVFPGLAGTRMHWKGAEGLAADVRAYGQWMRDEAERRIGHLYPKATLPDGTKATVIAWIWARTVTCPNPGCGIEMPLVRSWWLGKKPGKEAYAIPYLTPDPAARGGRRVDFAIGHDPESAPTPQNDGTVGRTGAVCIACQTAVDLRYIRTEGNAGRIGERLMAVAAMGARRRTYLPAVDGDQLSMTVLRPAEAPTGLTSDHPQYMGAHRYGMTEWSDLFTARQLTALLVFSDLVHEARERALLALVESTHPASSTDSGNEEPAAYADAIAIYLAMVVDRLADIGNSLCAWEPLAECPRHLFSSHRVPMVWDYAEGNALGESSGSWQILIEGASRAFASPAFSRGDVLAGSVSQRDAAQRPLKGYVICTDPPYYAAVPYADVSDFFYVWIRHSLSGVLPEILTTMLVPKTQELVANDRRQGGRAAAAAFFERGFSEVFRRAREAASSDFPITVFYAYKQTEVTAEGRASTGWESILEGMLSAGWQLTSTWPVRTEAGNRIRGQDSNALSSSVVLSLRPRSASAPVVDRRGFIAALRSELTESLRELQQGRISPVDLPQAAIGPGMAIFSRYSAVIEGDGSRMSVGAALARINEVLGEVQSEQEGDFDPTTRFAIAWFRQHGYAKGAFGDADNLARARATAVEAIARTGILTSGKSVVALIRPGDLPSDYAPEADERISAWEMLHHVSRSLDSSGVQAAGALLARAETRTDSAVDTDLVKELAFLLFAIAEDNRWTKEAVAFNAVATAWPDILAAARGNAPTGEQTSIDFPTANEIDEVS